MSFPIIMIYDRLSRILRCIFDTKFLVDITCF